MSLIDEVGYSAASVDGIASVQEAEEALDKNPTDPKAQYNYLAAYDNAIAAETAIIPVAGAVFASMAIKADVQKALSGCCVDACIVRHEDMRRCRSAPVRIADFVQGPPLSTRRNRLRGVALLPVSAEPAHG
ncbi:hypothetical protein [Burkholderia gladioli]|uniref:hypothetical protein n=1 Tax=Burkholderia gladioli TaxID=28095 RepID=UPI001FC8A0F9|nr:hypothetical protein [Burkholderia gladioli]